MQQEIAFVPQVIPRLQTVCPGLFHLSDNSTDDLTYEICVKELEADNVHPSSTISNIIVRKSSDTQTLALEIGTLQKKEELGKEVQVSKYISVNTWAILGDIIEHDVLLVVENQIDQYSSTGCTCDIKYLKICLKKFSNLAMIIRL